MTKKSNKTSLCKCYSNCNGKYFLIISFFVFALAVFLQPIDELSIHTKEKYVDPFLEKLQPPNFSVNLEIGKSMREKGLKMKHPIVFIPGYITTALEMWEGLECTSHQNSRSKIWGGFDMMAKLFLDRACWIQHMKLDPKTGLDPNERIRIRAGEGIKSVDFFIQGYFVFASLIDNLAQIGYDINSMYVATYDWRLGFNQMELRDRYFTRLKFKIEEMRIIHGQKTAVVCHSLGAVLFHNFLQWVAHTVPNGEKWIEDNVYTYINIAGPLLGVPKSIGALLSGEMKDTAQFGVLSKYILNPFLSLEQRTQLFRTWGSISEMLPKGNSKLWNQNFINFNILYDKEKNVTLDNLTEFLSESTDENMKEKLGSFDLNLHNSFEDKNNPKYWSNPLAVPLPNAPSLKIFCLYGYGKQTEEAYFYKPAKEENGVKYDMDVSMNDPNSTLSNGVFFGNGDGTVPLVSLGYPCYRSWRSKKYNPHNIKVVTREYKHNPLPIWEDVRGGATSSDHVDIMGNQEMIGDVIQIVSGNNVEDQITSEILDSPSVELLN